MNVWENWITWSSLMRNYFIFHKQSSISISSLRIEIVPCINFSIKFNSSLEFYSSNISLTIIHTLTSKNKYLTSKEFYLIKPCPNLHSSIVHLCRFFELFIRINHVLWTYNPSTFSTPLISDYLKQWFIYMLITT